MRDIAGHCVAAGRASAAPTNGWPARRRAGPLASVSRVSETFTVPARFCGPPESGNGGWTSGHLAALVAVTDGSPAASVRLRTPPPLDRAMAVRHGGARHGGGHGRRRAGRVGAAGRRARPRRRFPRPPPSPRPRPSPTATPACTTTRSRPASPAASTATRATRCACAPARSTTAPAGTPLPGCRARSTGRMVWAALDCPGAGRPASGGRPMVLGTMTARVLAAARGGRAARRHGLAARQRGTQAPLRHGPVCRRRRAARPGRGHLDRRRPHHHPTPWRSSS